jgi:hypothetical protein
VERVAITAYVDSPKHFIDEANQMTLSGSGLDSRFTFVLFVHPDSAPYIKKRHNVRVIPYKSRDDAYYKAYKYAKSFPFLKDNSHVLKYYDYIFKTDTDVFFSDHLNTHVFKDELYFGKGHYKSWAIEQMQELATNLGYSNYRNVIEPGATLFGPSEYVLSLMESADTITKEVFYYLCPDGDWESYFHVWGKSLFAGTSGMIGQELALVSCFNLDNVVISNKLDADSCSSDDVSSVYHIHQWHVDNVFSKFKAREGEYDSWDYRTDSSISSYCLNTFLKNKREL